MPDWNLVDRSHVLAALKECDRLGSRDFLSRYRFGRAKAYTLWHGGQEYDSKAVLGVAYLYAAGHATTREEFRGGETGAARVLKALGFDVVADEEALDALEAEERRVFAAETPEAPDVEVSTPKTKAPAKKKPAATPARAKPVERVVTLCPNCYTAVPATGICDFCD